MAARGFALVLLALPAALAAQKVQPPAANPSVSASQVDRAIDPAGVRVPTPLARTSSLAKLGLTPTQLESGRAVSYSADHLHDRDGQLTAEHVTIAKSSGTWLLTTPGFRTAESQPVGSFKLEFRAERARGYLVDFAIGAAPGRRFHVGSNSNFGAQSLIDGHIAVIVPAGAGGQQTVTVSPQAETGTAYSNGVALHYVKVTPLR